MKKNISNEKVKIFLDEIDKLNFNFAKNIKENDLMENSKDFAILFMLSLAKIMSSEKLDSEQEFMKNEFIEKILRSKYVINELGNFNKTLIDISINSEQKKLLKNTKRKKNRKKLI